MTCINGIQTHSFGMDLKRTCPQLKMVRAWELHLLVLIIQISLKYLIDDISYERRDWRYTGENCAFFSPILYKTLVRYLLLQLKINYNLKIRRCLDKEFWVSYKAVQSHQDLKYHHSTPNSCNDPWYWKYTLQPPPISKQSCHLILWIIQICPDMLHAILHIF